MVQAKHKKAARPKRQESVKKHGKQAVLTQFRSQLDALGLKVIEVTSDGNCFFRALADQLQGDAEEHKKYRHMVVEYIKNHREEFEPFIEDEVPFDEYCKSMEEDGTWAGNMELQAASLVTQSNICIHRLMSPRWYIRNFASHDARLMHFGDGCEPVSMEVTNKSNLPSSYNSLLLALGHEQFVAKRSYHDGEHYNSVRLKDDPCDGPAKLITIKVDADIAKASVQAKAAIRNSKATSHENNVDFRSVKMVMCGTGCENYSKAEQILKEVDGDVDAAIEYLIAEKRMDEDASTNDDVSSRDGISREHENGRAKQCVNGNMSNTTLERSNDLVLKHDNKEVEREKKLPQGSKKKQKLSGPVTPTKGSQATSLINSKSKIGKDKKDRRNAKKGTSSDVRVSSHDQGNLPDVGALCI